MLMFNAYQDTEELTQNLTDAGCSEEFMACFLSGLLKGNKAAGLCKLEERRAELLDEIRKERSYMEYLDELLCDLREQPRQKRYISGQ